MEIRVTVIQIFLLCFQTFADSAAQEENEIRCNVPVLENGRFSTRNVDASVGASMRAVCNQGYVIEDTRSGDEIQCQQGGNWDTDIVCIGRQCEDKDPPTNGRFNVTTSGLRYPASIRVVCNTGYERRPRVSNNLQCNADGRWIRTTGVCQGRQCNRIPFLVNGEYNWHGNDRPRYPKRLHAVCAPGYTLQNPSSNTITCGINSRWSMPHPVCRGVQCKRIDAPSHGYFTPNSIRLQYPSSVTAACITGYTLVTERILTCNTNGDWNGTHPGCQVKKCRVPPLPHGTYNLTRGNEVRFGGSIKASCNTGYLVDGASDGMTRCEDQGQWSPTITCAAKPCPSLSSSPSNGRYNSTSGSYGDMITLICNHGYVLHGQGQITCGVDGRWSSLSGSCQVKHCDPLVNPSHGQYNQTSGWYQPQSTLICDKGYQTQTPVTITCRDDGTWSLPVGTCQARPCERLRNSNHGNYTKGLDTLASYKDVTQFTCQPGYVIIVNGTQVDFYNRTCQSDKTWSGSEAECRDASFSVGKDSETYPWTVLLVGVGIGVALSLLSVLIIFASVAYTRRRRKKKSSANELYTIPTATREDTHHYGELERPDSFNGGNPMEEGNQYEITDP